MPQFSSGGWGCNIVREREHRSIWLLFGSGGWRGQEFSHLQVLSWQTTQEALLGGTSRRLWQGRTKVERPGAFWDARVRAPFSDGQKAIWEYAKRAQPQTPTVTNTQQRSSETAMLLRLEGVFLTFSPYWSFFLVSEKVVWFQRKLQPMVHLSFKISTTAMRSWQEELQRT